MSTRRPTLRAVDAAGLGTAGGARLLAEARAAAQLNHPNIVTIYDAGETDEAPFIVMELVEGVTLRAHRPAALHEALTIARQLAAALEQAAVLGYDLSLFAGW